MLETQKVAARYDRISVFYDFMELPFEAAFLGSWRRKVFEKVKGSKILEIGVGTGKNFEYYPRGAQITGIDISSRMLAGAKRKALSMRLNVRLQGMDAQDLKFSDSTFDAAVATFVFCSVPEPVKALREAARVVKEEGRIVLLEHVRPSNYFLGLLFDLLNPLVARVFGPNINRETVENVRKAGLQIESEENLLSDVVKLIVAKPKKGEAYEEAQN